jgi:hypothetical protein
VEKLVLIRKELLEFCTVNEVRVRKYPWKVGGVSGCAEWYFWFWH